VTLYAGTSGFSYSSWRGTFYPRDLPASRMLAYYASRLNGVEINGAFYRTPSGAALAGWANRTPSDFRFCLKGHRALTYSSDRFDRVALARDLAPRLLGLGDRLGPLLLQFPPSRERDLALLDSLLAALGLATAVEFRHESWYRDEVFSILRSHRSALVVTDQEDWPMAPRLELSGLAYYRLRRAYDRPSLERWRRELRAEATAREQLHVYFRHDSEGPARASFMLA
jgi:uncharacterized protein YecE (DUF72 family)